jgi:hypothetical protein
MPYFASLSRSSSRLSAALSRIIVAQPVTGDTIRTQISPQRRVEDPRTELAWLLCYLRCGIAASGDLKENGSA